MENKPKLTWLWIEDGQKSLSVERDFNDFNEAILFVDKVAEVAKRMDHHPKITIDFNKVILFLTTHSAGGLTNKDYELASKIEKIRV